MPALRVKPKGVEKVGQREIMIGALTYIEAHIEEPISLEVLARLEGYSVPQFYRIFKKLTGDTVAEYVMRRRVIQAALTLQKEEKTITQVAFQYGFESLDVFSRAFRRVYGVTPSEYRKNKGELAPLKRLAVNKENVSEKQHQMTYCIKEVEDFWVAGMYVQALTWDEDGAISKLWSDFLECLQDEIHIPHTFYGICECEHIKGGKQFNYMAAIGISEEEAQSGKIPAEFQLKHIRNQKFIEANVPQEISIPQAYVSTVQYAKSLSYEIERYDEIEVYGEAFKDADLYRFKLLVPIK